MPKFRLSCCLTGCVVAIVVPLIGAGGLYNWLTTPAGTREPRRTYTVLQRKHAVHRIESLRSAATQSVERAKAGRPAEFDLTLSEQDLNAYIAERLAKDPRFGGRGDIQVELLEGQAAVTGSVPFGTRSLTFRTEGPLRPGPGGAVYFDIRRVDLGRLGWALPSSVQTQLTDRLRTRAQRPILRLPGEIRSLEVHPGRLTVRGTAKPGVNPSQPGTLGAPPTGSP